MSLCYDGGAPLGFVRWNFIYSIVSVDEFRRVERMRNRGSCESMLIAKRDRLDDVVGLEARRVVR